MNVYAAPGKGLQQIGGDCPAGWVVMQSERPAIDHVAGLDGAWVSPKVPVPFSVSRYQGREAMRLTPYAKEGFPDWSLFDAFEELLSNPETPAYYRRAWDELQQFEYGSAMLNDAADVLGVTQLQRDDLFRLGASLKA